MTPSAVVFAEARKRGLVPAFDPAAQSVMIDGQRWDRWYATRDMIAPGALYIHHPHGTQVVLPGQAIRQDDEETLREHFPNISIRKRSDRDRRNRSNPRRTPRVEPTRNYSSARPQGASHSVTSHVA
jgi:hypothetical protein